MRGLSSYFSDAFSGYGLVAAANAAAAPAGGVTPLSPGPSDIFKTGENCTFTWTPDQSGVWKQTDVELMTGPNLAMVFLTTVASFDGTDASLTSFSFPCPEVDPNSAIYFYQFTSPAAPDKFWTTRFTIADAQGNSTPPPNATQPDGQQIPWGTGKLADPAQAVPIPSYLPGGAGASATTSTNATSSTAANATSSTASGSASSSSAGSTTTASGSGTSVVHVTATSTSTPSVGQAASTSTGDAGSSLNTGSGSGDPNGALAAQAGWGQVGLVFGLAALAVVATV